MNDSVSINLLIGFIGGALSVFVLWRITIHDLSKRIASIERERKVDRDQLDYCLITTGEIINGLGWKDRYGKELMRILLLRDKGTPPNTSTIILND